MTYTVSSKPSVFSRPLPGLKDVSNTHRGLRSLHVTKLFLSISRSGASCGDEQMTENESWELHIKGIMFTLNQQWFSASSESSAYLFQKRTEFAPIKLKNLLCEGMCQGCGTQSLRSQFCQFLLCVTWTLLQYHFPHLSTEGPSADSGFKQLRKSLHNCGIRLNTMLRLEHENIQVPSLLTCEAG